MSRTASLLRSAGSGLAGFIVYGGWAWYWNLDHGAAMGQRAGLLQGTYSFVLTFCSTLMMEFIYRHYASRPYARSMTITITGAVLFATPLTLHQLAGTPNLIGTILPGFLVGMIYTTVYVFSLARIAVPGSASSIEPEPRKD